METLRLMSMAVKIAANVMAVFVPPWAKALFALELLSIPPFAF